MGRGNEEASGRRIRETESVCPVCLQKLKAQIVAYGEEVFMEKTCAEHGSFQALIWKGKPSYESWQRPKIPAVPINPVMEKEKGCPYDCGLCPEHRQHSCCVLLEITDRCNLNCPVCFAKAGEEKGKKEPDLKEIEAYFTAMLSCGGPFNIQLSGGEPTLREDLSDIIRLGRKMGFSFFQLNTNGIRLAAEPDYARKLKTAGLSCVFLQFDGIREETYEKLRGRALLKIKKQAIEHCGKAGLGVVLVPVIAKGINEDEVGSILQFALDRLPVIRGVHFQPMSFFGRYDPLQEKERFTLPQLLQAIEAQTGGQMRMQDFSPAGAENAYCSFSGNFIRQENGRVRPWKNLQEENTCSCQTPAAIPEAKEAARQAREFVARQWSGKEECCCNSDCNTASLDLFLEQINRSTLAVSAMAFMDAWNLDLERLRDCYIHVAAKKEKTGLIPFCAYNLTAIDATSLYRDGKNCRTGRKNAEEPHSPTSVLDSWIQRKHQFSSEEWTRAGLEKWQLQKLSEVIALAGERSPFYQKRYKGLSLRKNFSDFENYPFIDEAILRSQGGKLLCTSQKEIARVVTLTTSGTGCQPKRLFFTQNDRELTIDFFANGMEELTEEGEAVAVCLPVKAPDCVGDLLIQGLERKGRKGIGIGMIENLREAVIQITAAQAKTAVGAPVQLLGLMEHARFQGIPLPLKKVLTSTEKLPEEVCARLKGFGLQVFEHFGMTECGLGAALDCHAHQGMHIRENDLYMEITDEAGKPVPDGSFGELTVTTLTREGMPLIRYRTGDEARILPGQCSCKSILRRLEVKGRKKEPVFFGKTIHELDEILFSYRPIIDYRVKRQENRGTVTLYFFEAPKEAVRNQLEESIGREGITYHYEKVSDSLPAYCGKRRIAADREKEKE